MCLILTLKLYIIEQKQSMNAYKKITIETKESVVQILLYSQAHEFIVE